MIERNEGRNYDGWKGASVQDQNSTTNRTNGGPRDLSGLLAKVRNRTEKEHDPLTSVDGSPYSAAALGQAPYVAMGNGTVIVQRRCNDWNC